MSRLVLAPAPILERCCAEFDDGPKAAAQLANDLTLTMRMHRGIGLSAPQIGRAVRAFAMRREADDETLACFNPEVVERFSPARRMREGCLSYPGIFVHVQRFERIGARWQNALGDWTEVELRGRDAQAFQHEADHLDGVLLPSRVTAMAWQVAKARAMAEAR